MEGPAIAFGGRGGSAEFTTPDVKAHLKKLVLTTPSALADLHGQSFEEILDFLSALAQEKRIFARTRTSAGVRAVETYLRAQRRDTAPSLRDAIPSSTGRSPRNVDRTVDPLSPKVATLPRPRPIRAFGARAGTSLPATFPGSAIQLHETPHAPPSSRGPP